MPISLKGFMRQTFFHRFINDVYLLNNVQPLLINGYNHIVNNFYYTFYKLGKLHYNVNIFRTHISYTFNNISNNVQPLLFNSYKHIVNNIYNNYLHDIFSSFFFTVTRLTGYKMARGSNCDKR